MSLTVETGTGATDSQVYASLDYVTTYCSNMGYTSWASGTTSTWESAMLRAMVFIDSLNFYGVKKDRDQALEWPRDYLLDRAGYSIPSDEIPTVLKKAFAEASYREYASSGCLLPSLSRGGKIKKKRIDVIETEYFSSAPSGTTYPVIYAYLKGLIRAGGTYQLART